MKNTFVLYENRFGFGWNVYDMRGKQAINIYHTPDKNDAKQVQQLLFETQNYELIPAIFNSNWVPVILQVREKYGEMNYLAKTEEECKLIMLRHLASNIKEGIIYKMDIPEATITDADVKSVKFDLQVIVLDKQNREDILIKDAKRNNKYYDVLQKSINSGSVKSIHQLFDYFCQDMYEIIKFDNLKY